MKRSLLFIAAFAVAVTCTAAEKKPMNQPDPRNSKSAAAAERITFGGGCFWCIEAVFQRLQGVKKVTSGYAGGPKPNPTYEEVCSGNSGHAEVVQLEFDPSQITYGKLLEIFWAAHDPTTLNRQGGDSGPQYRSIILYENEAQKIEAEKSKKQAQSEFQDRIVTEIVPLKAFYKAEAYHQNYFNLNASRNPYCQIVIRPKLQQLLKKGMIREESTP